MTSLRKFPIPLLLLSVSLLLQAYSFAWIFGPVSRSKASNLYFARHAQHNEEKLDLNILLLDHYDSFTYNLADLLAQLCVRPPTVLAADCADSWEELVQQQLEGCSFDGIVLSPGPGHPSDPICQLSRDCVEQNSNLPILGVCLGHQILGSVYGATVQLAPEPVHGQVKGVHLLKTTALNDDKNALWKDIATTDEPVQVTRYHSLQVTNLEATRLTPTAVAVDDAVVMAMQHDEHPHFGVQFHPESIGTNATGKQLLYNFLQVCLSHQKATVEKVSASEVTVVGTEASFANFTERKYVNTGNGVSENTFRTNSTAAAPPSVYIHKVADLPVNGAAMQPLDVMEEILADEDYSFWLDDSQVDAGQRRAISILGASRQRVEY